MVPNQLALPVKLPDDETFDSFEVGENTLAIDYLKKLLENKDRNPINYISGESGTGKTHLLYSLFAAADTLCVQGFFINFKDKSLLSPEVMYGLENSSFICLDDVHLLKDDLSWQIAIFDLINRVIEKGTGFLLISGDQGPKQLGFELADLQSRLTWGMSFHLLPLSDELRIDVLINRARRRGLDLSKDVGRYILTHCQRDMGELMDTLDRLDSLSLQEKRKLTVPFVKKALSL